MIYSPAKIKKLLEMVEDNLAEEEQEIIREIVSNYNRLFMLAKEKTEYVKRKEMQYAEETKENEKLKQRNEELEIKIIRLTNQNKEQRETIKIYKKYIGRE